MPSPSRCHVLPLVLLLPLLALIALPAQADDAGTHLATLAQDLPAALSASQPVLLGRKRKGQQAITAVAKRGMVTRIGHGTTNSVIMRMQDANGGIGMRFVHLTFNRNVGGPRAEYAWHQGAFRTWLTQQKEANADPLQKTQAVDEVAAALLPLVLAWEAVPDDLAVPNVSGGEAWPMHCLAQLTQALRGKDIDATKRWALELRGATFALADLHRWTELLLANPLRALDFQVHAEGCFNDVDPVYGGNYNKHSHIGRLPVGEITLYGGDNYLEVERQAEGLFWTPDAWKQADAAPVLEHHAIAFLPPTERGLFLRINEAIAGKTRDLWNEAPGTPYERSFLANMLWRAQAAEFSDGLLHAVQAYEKQHGRNPDLAGLMDVLPYRAGAFFAGMEWGDRYDPDILKASANINRPGEQGMQQAYAEASKGYSDYTGMVLTIRAARETGRADCIRITDIMAALFRNAGQPGFRSVRMSRGVIMTGGRPNPMSGRGHTIAGITSGSLTGGREPLLTYDGLIKGGARTVYPAGYLDDQTYTTEIYGRGIDSYVWMAGVIGAGENKGRFMTAVVPYLPDGQEETDTTVGGAGGGRSGGGGRGTQRRR